MRRLYRVLALLCAWTLLPLAAPAAAEDPVDPDVIPGRYIVTLEPGEHPRDVARDYDRRSGADVDAVYETALRGFAGELSHGELQRAKNDPRVASVEPDRVVTIDATQQAPSTSGLWGLDRIDQRALPLSRTYEYHQTGAGVRVYVLDTGIHSTHEDFGGRVTGGYTAFNDGQGTADCNGHGTHVAGTIGGTVSGVAKQVTLVPVRVLGRLHSDGTCPGSGTVAGVVAGVDWVTAQHKSLGGPSVANMSLGSSVSTTLDSAVRRSISAGVTYAVAAGNANADACNYSPAGVREALTVGATRSDDRRASFSNHGSCVDLFAPGQSIRSAWHVGNDLYHTISGTSMAAPHLAGIAALYLQGRPNASPASVGAALLEHATPGVVVDALGSPNKLAFSMFQLPELSVAVTGPADLALGATGTWTVTVSNNGPAAATDFPLEMDLPAALEWASGSHGCTQTGCTLSLGAQDSVDVTVTAKAVTATYPGTATVTATATAGAETEGSTSTTIYAALAELELTLAGPGTAVAGEAQTYTAVVENKGPAGATGAVVTFDLPEDASYTPAGSCSKNSEDTQVTCLVGELDVGEEAKQTVEVEYVPLPETEEEWALSASVASDEYNGITAANRATVATLVYPGRADLALTLDGPDVATVGEDHAFVATVDNAEGDTAERVTVVLQVPTGLSFRTSPAPTPGCSHANRVVTCELAAIQPEQSSTVGFTLRADSSGTRTLAGAASAAQYDANPANNSRAHDVVVASAPSGGGGFAGGGGGGGVTDPEPAPSPSPSPSPTPAVEDPDDTLVVQDVGEDGTVTTDPDGAGATADEPVHAAVTTPNGGTVSITRGTTTTAAPAGWDLLGVQVDISAPAATTDEPLTLRFLLDSSVLPDDGSIDVLRNGVPVGSCPGSAIADPDPCVTSQRFVGDDLEIVVRTSRASAWNFGVPASSAVDCTNPPPAGFADTDPSSVHTPNIDCLVALEVARGTSASTYGPAQPVTRGQMATFIVGALEAAGVAVPPGQTTFSDVEGSVHRERIGQLVAAGITHGATATTYEPAQAVTRAQMATFLVRAHAFATGTELPPGSTTFADVASSVHRDSIERAAGAGLVAGRTATTYDPDAAVRRDQMATFLVRLLAAL